MQTSPDSLAEWSANWADIEPDFRNTLSFLSGQEGSCFRPRVVQAAAKVVDLPPALRKLVEEGLEYFHTASLVFDDLPSMDDAATRRGLPCVHKLYGEDSATLGALALINRAYVQLWRALAMSEEVDSEALIQEVEDCLGLEGILNGQALDLRFSGGSAEDVMRVAELKTGSLLRLALVVPAMLGGVTEVVVDALKQLSRFWGYAYQGLDDLKDIYWPAELSGKTGQRDEEHGRPNLVSALGEEQARRRIRSWLDAAHGKLVFLERLQPGWREALESLHQQFESTLAKILQKGEAA